MDHPAGTRFGSKRSRPPSTHTSQAIEQAASTTLPSHLLWMEPTLGTTIVSCTTLRRDTTSGTVDRGLSVLVSYGGRGSVVLS